GIKLNPVSTFLGELQIHRLQHRGMDEQLLKPLEEKGFIWLGCAADVSKLEPMFRKRFVRFSTELPTQEELGDWLADRCEGFEVAYEPEAILRLVERSNCVPGIALQALELASLYPGRKLTVELVEDFTFEVDT